VVENGMKIDPYKSKTIRFTRARVKNPLGYSLGDQKIPAASSCKYVGNLRSDLKVGGPSKLHSAKTLEGTSVCNECFQRMEIGIQNV
jgi:hypothetical protein